MANIKKRIIKRSEVRYDARMRVNGRMVNKTFRRRADAERWAREMEVARDRGTDIFVTPSKIVLADYAPEYLATRVLAPRTEELYSDLLRRFILPEFGKMPISAIRTERVRAWHTSVTRRVSELQAAKAYRLLRAILNQAVEDELLPKNPCTIRGAGQESSPERPLATPEIVVALADAIEPRYRAMVLLAGVGALRLGELLGMEVRHIKDGAVEVKQQAQELRRGGRVITKPKRSPAAVRTVSIPEFASCALQEHIAHYSEPGPNGHVFTGPNGGPLRRATFYTAWHEAKGKVEGSEPFNPHDLRHAAGTIAAWTGASTKELMSRLGHSTPQAALRYQHAAQSRDAELAKRIGEVFQPKPPLG